MCPDGSEGCWGADPSGWNAGTDSDSGWGAKTDSNTTPAAFQYAVAEVPVA